MIDHHEIADILAREMAELQDVARNPDQRHLWIWQTDQALVAPSKMRRLPQFEQANEEMRSRNWPVHLRSTGGDVTPQGAGIVNLTHIYASPPGERFDLAREYHRLCQPIARALGDQASIGWQPGAFCDGAYNVQWRGKKFAGTAMRFRPCINDKSRFAVLSHALMLFEPPNEPAIHAINSFLELLGENRVIRQDAHTGLPHNIKPANFCKLLLDGFSTGSG